MNIKIVILIFVTAIIYNPVFGCWEGCIVDRCTGEPLPNYPLTYMQPGEKGLRGIPVEIMTDEDGCFKVEGVEGSQLFIGERSFVFQSGPCQQLGDIGMFNGGGHLQMTTNNQIVDISQFPYGPSSQLPVIHGFGCSDNYLELSYTFGSSACARYKIFNDNNELIHEFDGSYRHDAGNFAIDVRFPESGIYRIEYTLFCCDSEGVVDESYSETFVGVLNFQMDELDDGDVDFDWIGSVGTEQINQDGNLLDNVHPSDGDLMQLGELTCGSYLSEELSTNNLWRFRQRLEKLPTCNSEISGSVLFESDEIVTDAGAVNPGYIPLVVNFNSLTNGYFLTSTDYTKGETCFKYSVRAYYAGNSNTPDECFIRSNSAIFQIADDCLYCMTVEDVTPEIASDIGLTSTTLNTSRLDLRDEAEFLIYPNPVQDILYVSGGDQIETMTILSSTANIFYNGSKFNQINMQDYPAGLYFMKCINIDGTTQIHKIIKK